MLTNYLLDRLLLDIAICTANQFIHSCVNNLTQSEPSTGALLPEHLRVVLLAGLQGLLSLTVADPAPVVLAVVGIVHEQWPVHIWNGAVPDKGRDPLVEALVDVLKSGVDLRITRRNSVAEVKLEDDVVVLGIEVEKVLCSC